MTPRLQRALAVAAILLLLPLFGMLAAAVRLTSRGPVMHRAQRVRPGGTFTLYKFRTMVADGAGLGPAVTAAGDARVTRVGRVLRRTKLDELPQLWNVVRGDMLLVGPRPEDPRYVDWSDPLHRRVFEALPGITGPTALAFRDEEKMLATAARDYARAEGRTQPTDGDVDRAYRERILPSKLESDARYLATRSASNDAAVLGRTISQVLRRTEQT